MESYSTLAELIEILELGSRYYISVEFLGQSLHSRFCLLDREKLPRLSERPAPAPCPAAAADHAGEYPVCGGAFRL